MSQTIIPCPNCQHKARVPSNKTIRYNCPECTTSVTVSMGTVTDFKGQKSNAQGQNDKKGLLVIVEEIFSPVTKYWQGLVAMNQLETLANDIRSGRFTLRDLTRISLGTIIFNAALGAIGAKLIDDPGYIFKVIDIPILNEFLVVIIFYTTSLINAAVARTGLNSNDHKHIDFEHIFLGATLVPMIALPIFTGLEVFAKLIMPVENVATIETGMGYGIIVFQISLISGVVSKTFRVPKKRILIPLIIANVILAVIVMITILYSF